MDRFDLASLKIYRRAAMAHAVVVAVTVVCTVIETSVFNIACLLICCTFLLHSAWGYIKERRRIRKIKINNDAINIHDDRPRSLKIFQAGIFQTSI